jgi:hypothetical protein
MQEADRFTGEVSDAVMTYGIRADNAQIRAKDIVYREKGVGFTIRMPSVSTSYIIECFVVSIMSRICSVLLPC